MAIIIKITVILKYNCAIHYSFNVKSSWHTAYFPAQSSEYDSLVELINFPHN